MVRWPSDKWKCDSNDFDLWRINGGNNAAEHDPTNSSSCMRYTIKELESKLGNVILVDKAETGRFTGIDPRRGAKVS